MSLNQRKARTARREEQPAGRRTIRGNFADLSANAGNVQRRAEDRRVMRTRKLLRVALHSLIREKDYDEIVVKEILDRADVGRSAFYIHFRDKDELLASMIQEILGPVPAPRDRTRQSGSDRVLWFSLPILQHHEQNVKQGAMRIRASARAILHGHLRNVLAKLVANELGSSRATGRRNSAETHIKLLADYVASTFVLVLDWWLENGAAIPADEANQIFRRMVLPSLE